MNRRRFLAASTTIGATLLAGCTSSGGSGADPTTAPTPPRTAEPTTVRTTSQETTEPTTAEQVADATVTDSTLEVTEGQHRTTAAVTGTIENTGNVPLLTCNALAKFYNEDDELLNSNGWQIMGLLPGETWVPWLQYFGDGSKVERATFDVDRTSTARSENIYSGGSSFRVEESNVEVPVDDGAMPRFTANVRNETGSEVARVRFIGKVYDDAGRVLANGTQVVTAFGPGEVWDVEAAINMGGDRGDRISNHEVLLFSLR